MPQTRLKEKTKRTAASSENPPMNQQPFDEIDMDDETSSDEEDLPEKDEAELKLERMLFGDDEGFMGALKSQQERADAMQLTLHSDEESGSDDEGEEGYEENVEDMADADVCSPLEPSPRFYFAKQC
jgi:U3 small nucleolar RNA-associated protein 18